MTLLQALQFAYKGVNESAVSPVYRQLCFYANRVQGGDSKITFDCELPYEFPTGLSVDGSRLLAAIEICEDDLSAHTTDVNLIIKREGFRAYLKHSPAEHYPIAIPQNDGLLQDGSDLIPALTRIKPFISKDASRPWTLGAWLQDGFAYATNNVSLVRTPCLYRGKPFNIPHFAVEALTTNDLEVSQIWREPQSVTAIGKDKFIRFSLLATEWPDSAVKLVAAVPAGLPPLPSDVVTHIKRLLPFCDRDMPAVLFEQGLLSVPEGDHYAVADTPYDFSGKYRADVLLNILKIATHWDPSLYPHPIPFRGPDIEGIFVGLKQ